MILCDHCELRLHDQWFVCCMTFATVTSVTFVIMSNVGKLGGFHIPFANLATWACVERNIGAVTSRILFNEK